ncbi:MAG: MotA/TolQ/ExbB proton channel family protein [Deltaproteobacteria bacterium]|nr:MotA/TolQ/ExbB proton channel family protein [Deltaproteobacteria bacterium]
MGKQIVFSSVLLTSIFMLSFNHDAGGVGLVSNLMALAFVVGGTLAIALMVYPWKRLVWTARMVKKTFHPLDKPNATILAIVHLARSYRQGWDIRNLERQGKDLPPGLLKTGVELIACRYDRNKMKQVLYQEATSVLEQYENAVKMIHNLSQLALSLGLIGTFVNFIRFYGSSRDLEELAGYAVAAFLSIFYGVLLGKLGLVLLADRMKGYCSEEMSHLDLVQEGMMGIQDREHPRSIRFRLESHLAPRDTRDSIVQAPEIEIAHPEEVALGSKRIGSVLVN